MKEGFILVEISKNEAFAMRKICGSHSVKSTFGKRHKSYFLVENPRNLNALNKYRSERTLLSVCESDIKNK